MKTFGVLSGIALFNLGNFNQSCNFITCVVAFVGSGVRSAKSHVEVSFSHHLDLVFTSHSDQAFATWQRFPVPLRLA